MDDTYEVTVALYHGDVTVEAWETHPTAARWTPEFGWGHPLAYANYFNHAA